jgi:hypothetical protein
MPRRKESPRSWKFQTCFPDKFQRWLMYELANVRQWNKDKFFLTTALNVWTFETNKAVIPAEGWYKISYADRMITVESQMPAIILRSGLVINMGQGRIEVSASSK